ncbi:MAG: hypothetical protein ACYC0B_07175 [Gemmatimonadaceae bacterium]
MRTSFSRRTLALVLVASSGCVELPLEHTNYLDPGTGSSLTIIGVPDTLNSISETFTASVLTTPDFPPIITGASWKVVAGQELLLPTGARGAFQVKENAGFIPVMVRLRAYIASDKRIADTGPSAERTIVVRQRPVRALVSCASSEGCAAVSGLQVERSLSYQLRDSLGFLVNLPAGAFRYGTVVSRAPGVVSVQSRPTATFITVRTEAPGSAWIVLLGAGAVSDSLRINVTP